MTVAELIEELKEYPPKAEVVVVGHSWLPGGEPEEYHTAPELSRADGRVVIRA